MNLMFAIIVVGQLTVQDEGILKGTATGVDCRGDNTQCVVQSGKWRLTVGDGGMPPPADAPYWTSSSVPGLTNEVNLGALSTGLVLNTTGTPSTYAGSSCGANQWVSSLGSSGSAGCTQPAFSNISGTLDIPQGGTGQNTIAINQVWVGDADDRVAAKTIPDCSNAVEGKLLYDNSNQTFTCGTDQTGSGSLNTVETSIALDGAGVYSVVVTGEAWVLTTSKITCTPFGTTADGLTPEAIAVAALVVSWSTPVLATGFTVWVDNPRGLTGTIRIHCSGA